MKTFSRILALLLVCTTLCLPGFADGMQLDDFAQIFEPPVPLGSSTDEVYRLLGISEQDAVSSVNIDFHGIPTTYVTYNLTVPGPDKAQRILYYSDSGLLNCRNTFVISVPTAVDTVSFSDGMLNMFNNCIDYLGLTADIVERWPNEYCRLRYQGAPDYSQAFTMVTGFSIWTERQYIESHDCYIAIMLSASRSNDGYDYYTYTISFMSSLAAELIDSSK